MDVLSYREVTDNDYKVIGENFARSAKENDMTVFACFEDRNLCEYGFSHDECLSPALAYKLTGKEYPRWTAREGNKCHCVQMADVGEYNTCRHFCKYCYANYDEKRVRSNCKVHYEDSSLLIGRLKKNDVIKLRKDWFYFSNSYSAKFVSLLIFFKFFFCYWNIFYLVIGIFSILLLESFLIFLISFYYFFNSALFIYS